MSEFSLNAPLCVECKLLQEQLKLSKSQKQLTVSCSCCYWKDTFFFFTVLEVWLKLSAGVFNCGFNLGLCFDWCWVDLWWEIHKVTKCLVQTQQPTLVIVGETQVLLMTLTMAPWQRDTESENHGRQMEFSHHSFYFYTQPSLLWQVNISEKISL